jgi:hypothetical protein
MNKTMKTVIIIGAIALLVISLFSSYNKLVRLDQQSKIPHGPKLKTFTNAVRSYS